MIRTLRFTLTAGIALAFVAIAPAGAAIKCWTNHEGVRECGNAVPPEFAQKGHETLNKQGLTTRTKEAAKTLEELEAERTAAAARRAEARKAAEQKQADKVLLDTFASEDDLVLTRDGQIAHLDSQIRLVESHIEKLRSNLDQMIERAAEMERRGKKPSADMIKDIDNVRAQITENEAFIADKHAEQQAIRERFDADIERFRELKGSAAR
ncbi:MAG: hypothetical protein RLW61_13155 [Gammaproteobacteria bacterium]